MTNRHTKVLKIAVYLLLLVLLLFRHAANRTDTMTIKNADNECNRRRINHMTVTVDIPDSVIRHM